MGPVAKGPRPNAPRRPETGAQGDRGIWHTTQVIARPCPDRSRAVSFTTPRTFSVCSGKPEARYRLPLGSFRRRGRGSFGETGGALQITIGFVSSTRRQVFREIRGALQIAIGFVSSPTLGSFGESPARYRLPLGSFRRRHSVRSGNPAPADELDRVRLSVCCTDCQRATRSDSTRIQGHHRCALRRRPGNRGRRAESPAPQSTRSHGRPTSGGQGVRFLLTDGATSVRRPRHSAGTQNDVARLTVPFRFSSIAARGWVDRMGAFPLPCPHAEASASRGSGTARPDPDRRSRAARGETSRTCQR
jgi:hypothetical protein